MRDSLTMNPVTGEGKIATPASPVHAPKRRDIRGGALPGQRNAMDLRQRSPSSRREGGCPTAPLQLELPCASGRNLEGYRTLAGTMQLTRLERGIHAAETNGQPQRYFPPDAFSFAHTFWLLLSDHDGVRPTLALPTLLRHECRAPTASSRLGRG